MILPLYVIKFGGDFALDFHPEDFAALMEDKMPNKSEDEEDKRTVLEAMNPAFE